LVGGLLGAWNLLGRALDFLYVWVGRWIFFLEVVAGRAAIGRNAVSFLL
jgi:hypothetical protein